MALKLGLPLRNSESPGIPGLHSGALLCEKKSARRLPRKTARSPQWGALAMSPACYIHHSGAELQKNAALTPSLSGELGLWADVLGQECPNG